MSRIAWQWINFIYYFGIISFHPRIQLGFFHHFIAIYCLFRDSQKSDHLPIEAMLSITNMQCQYVDVVFFVLTFFLVCTCDEPSNLFLSGTICFYLLRDISLLIVYYCNDLMHIFFRCLREQGHYKNPTNSSSWRRPPVEEVRSFNERSLPFTCTELENF